ncbi:MAG: CAP domain-containing protein, partial [Microvirga sp.]
VDRRLNTVAAAQARANAEIGELSHDAGGSFPVRLASFGAADRARAAENLAAGSATLEATIAQWKASGEHDKNLLMRDAAHIGIARFDAPGARMKHFWALVLAAQ